MNDCIFCKIIDNKIPAKKLFESDKVLAFLDIMPLSEGHFLIIPKTHTEKMHQVPDDELQEVLVTAKSLTKKLNLENYNILQNNGRIAHQVVMHVHFHLIPKPDSETGLKMEWDSLSMTDEDLEKIKKKFL
jgi:diadenosine tetraphosphate (Ap4A) HIT family hydrolase